MSDCIYYIYLIQVEQVYNDYIKPVGNEKFFLHQRSLHVYQESKLVRDFEAVCQKPKYDKQLEDLGHLMNQSHASCRDNFECSCPELEILTDICRYHLVSFIYILSLIASFMNLLDSFLHFVIISYYLLVVISHSLL
jgi:hypothetical protein